MRAKAIIAIILTAIVFFNLSGCERSEQTDNAVIQPEASSPKKIQKGGTYRLPLLNNPKTLDPGYVQDQYGVSVVRQLFDGLVQFGPYLAILPALAETWKVEDQGKTYQFTLRRDATFHNGDPVQAQDVIFSLQRLLRINPPSIILPYLLKIQGAQEFHNKASDQIQGLEILNDHTMVIRLTEPFAPFLTALGMYQASIVPERILTKSNINFDRAPIGSGPFQLGAWHDNAQIVLERFADYYAGEAFLEGINYIIYPGAPMAQISSDFVAGKLEEMPSYGNLRQSFTDAGKYQWFHRPSLSLLFYGIVGNHPLLKSLEFRQALSMAIDRQELVKSVYQEQFEPARTILPPGMPAYQPPTKQEEAGNLGAAQMLVKNALRKGSITAPAIEIVSASKSAFAQNEFKYISQRWKQIGVKLDVKYITDWAKFEDYLSSDAVQLYRYVWFADIPDPDNFMAPLFASDSSTNFMQYHNPDVDRLLAEARGITDLVKRAEIYQNIERIILGSYPIIPLFYLSTDRVYQPSVQGIHFNALGPALVPFHRLWIDTNEFG